MLNELQKKLMLPENGKYIIAVSGGVDSVVLLDLLRNQSDLELIVAHFDHGMRQESIEDRKFVEGLANKYKLPFEYGEGNLGEASEVTARAKRYEFLEQVKVKYKATGIVTAHHLDDRIETLLLNLMRGTGRQGMAPFGASIVRPLAKAYKTELLEYAKAQNLEWREDSTNQDSNFTRNKVRNQLVPALEQKYPDIKERLVGVIESYDMYNPKLDALINQALELVAIEKGQTIEIDRSLLLCMSDELATEVLYSALRRLNPGLDFTKQHIKRFEHFAKTASPGKVLELLGPARVYSLDTSVRLELGS